MFTELFGESPQTKILDFLADHPDYDYSISEISRQAKVSRPTVYKIKDILLKKELIIQTREQGGSPLYKLNTENKIVQVMLKFDFEIAKKIADRESQESGQNYAPTLLKPQYKARNQKTEITPS